MYSYSTSLLYAPFYVTPLHYGQYVSLTNFYLNKIRITLTNKSEMVMYRQIKGGAPMRKLITLAALVVLATGDFALADNCAKKSCCGTCKKGAAVEQSQCAKEKSCEKKTEGCEKKAGGCEKSAEAGKSKCAK
jgi:hypothetical protein